MIARLGALAAVVLAAAGAVEAGGGRAVLSDIRPIWAVDHARLVLDIGRRVIYRARPEPPDPDAGQPERLVIELFDTDLAPALKAPPLPAVGPLRALELGRSPEGHARLELIVPGLSDYRVFRLPDPFRLVVDVEGSGVPATPEVLPTPALAALEQTALRAPGTDGAPVVVLDPGHGGEDPGARGPHGLLEKDVTLDIARRSAEVLRREGVRVVLTRTDDRRLSLPARTAAANRLGASLFVSIHANASPRAEASGIETYYLDNTEDRATLRLAGMENNLRLAAGEDGVRDVAVILSDLIQGYKVKESTALARMVQHELVAAARRRHRGVRDLGVKPGPFYVLVGAGMPCVLAEVSFLTHPREGCRLAEPAYRQALAEGLARGIRRFLERGPAVAGTL